MVNLLELKGLTTHFYTDEGVVRAVQDLSYQLNEGEILGIVGESGCGKSVSALSVMRLIADPPGKIVSGQVLFEGQNLLDLSESEMRNVRGNRISMVFQEPMTSLNPVLTIGKQLTETLVLHLGMTTRSAYKRALELLDMVGISDPSQRLKDYPHQLSGGMRQRVMIAIAISCNPKVIIADEPTTALDVTIQAQILELLKSLTNEIGTALVIITHNLGVVARYATRVLVMYSGKIIESGRSIDTYNNPSHPYTIGMLGSVPRLDKPSGTRLLPIQGIPPDLIETSIGCSFSPRCAFSSDICNEKSPELIKVGDDHFSACWRLNEIPSIANRTHGRGE